MTAASLVAPPKVSDDPGADSARIATAFMLLSIGVMLPTLALALLLQTAASHLICAAIYGGKVAVERRCGIISPLTLTLLACYLGLWAAGMAGVDLEGYTGVVVFSVLAVLVGGLLAAGRPFTTYYSHGRGNPHVHRLVSWIWLGTYLLAIAATLLLIPDRSFMVVPPAICLAGACATLFVSFCWTGPRRSSFSVGDLSFAPLASDDPRFAEVCHFYAQAIAQDPRQGFGELSVDQVADQVRASERAAGERSHVFVCWQRERIVGCVRCLIDQPGVPFPTEVDGGFSLDPLRRLGRVMVVGRLAIADDARARPDVLSNLFACFVNLALEHDVDWVLSAGFRHVLPTYMRLGFELLFHRSDARHGVRMSHGYISHPVLLDFRRLIFERARVDAAKLDFYGVTNKLLAERYYKRALVRGWFAAATARRRPQDIHAVRALLGPGGSNANPS